MTDSSDQKIAELSQRGVLGGSSRIEATQISDTGSAEVYSVLARLRSREADTAK